MSKIKTRGLDQYGAEDFEQQQFGAAVVERVKFKRLICFSQPELLMSQLTSTYCCNASYLHLTLLFLHFILCCDIKAPHEEHAT